MHTKKRIVSILGFIFFFLLGTLRLFLMPVFADTPDTTSSISASPSELVADGTTVSTVTVTLRSSNTLITSGTVTLSASNNATVDQGSYTVNSTGVATFTVRSTTVGSSTITVSYNGTTVDNVSTTLQFDTPPTPTLTPTPTPLNYCGDATPGNAPSITSAVSSGAHQITLTWSPATAPVTSYLLTFGLTSGTYIYGAPNIGGSDARSYTVGNLATGTIYYFAIRAVNGCAQGALSNEVSAKAGGSIATPTPTTVTQTVSSSSDTSDGDSLLTSTPTDTPTPEATPIPENTDTTSSLVKPLLIAGIGIGIIAIVFGVLWFLQWKKKSTHT